MVPGTVEPIVQTTIPAAVLLHAVRYVRMERQVVPIIQVVLVSSKLVQMVLGEQLLRVQVIIHVKTQRPVEHVEMASIPVPTTQVRLDS